MNDGDRNGKSKKLNVEGGVYNEIGGGANRKFMHAA
jgi:hypothetical protein